MYNKTLIAIVGPTAIGKTSTGIAIAQRFNADILSSDSRQFYKEMSIGTAVPNQVELDTVPHHFIHHISIHEHYSVGKFEQDAINFVTDYFKDKDVVVMVGGSGLYEKAVTQGLDDIPKVSPEIRSNLKQELENLGLEALQTELAQKDIDYYNETDIYNPKRVIRALEIIRGTGKPFSSFRKDQKKLRPFNIIKIGLNLPRDQVYDRINRRVDIMMDEGLLQEVKSLYKYKNLNALQTVGYRELFAYLDGEMSLEEAIAEIKKNTRRYAKRQLTWYRKDPSVKWFTPFEFDAISSFLDSVV